MKVIIMGCGRVGAALAVLLDAEGHQVTILDLESYSFRRLPSSFKGMAMVGNGIDQDTLRAAGIEGTDVFIALTQGDNRSIMACQIAKHIFNVSRVVCRIKDPIREELYRGLGLVTYCRTTQETYALKHILEE